MSTLWFIGENLYNECNVPEDENDIYELNLCKWSQSMRVVGVIAGNFYNIYSVQSKQNELLCFGFIRESQQYFPFIKNSFFIIPDQVSALCFSYFGHLEQFKEYWAAGNNKYGQCGVNDEKEELPLSRVEGMEHALNEKIKSGVCGGSTLWIKHDGKLYVNGKNTYGQLGMNGTNNINIPTLSTFTQEHSELRVIDGASSEQFNVVISDDDSVWFAGRIGKGTLNSDGAFIPLKIPNSHVIASVSAGDDHILFLTRNGNVLSLGKNDYGQLGVGYSMDDQYSDLQLISFFVENNIKIQSACCGFIHSVALSTDGKVYGWGSNHYGQCGPSNIDVEDIPKAIGIVLKVAVKRIECGHLHSGLMTTDNNVYLWGGNRLNECCDDYENSVSGPRNVTDFVLSQSEKSGIIDFYLGFEITMFLLE